MSASIFVDKRPLVLIFTVQCTAIYESMHLFVSRYLVIYEWKIKIKITKLTEMKSEFNIRFSVSVKKMRMSTGNCEIMLIH